MPDIRVPEHIYGQPGVAHGGYVAGLLASRRASPKPARVDFRAPVPVGRVLELSETQSGARLADGDRLLAELSPADLDVAVPDPPTWERACAAVDEYLRDAPVLHRDCFGCGPDRADGLGLRVFPGLVPGANLVASAWTPSAQFRAANDGVGVAWIWAALDCPGGWARRRLAGAPPRGVTASMTATTYGPVDAGGRYVVIGWPIDRESRKTIVGSAILTTGGDVVAAAHALWIDTREPDRVERWQPRS